MLGKDCVLACALFVKAALPLQGVRVEQQKLLQLSGEASSVTSEAGPGPANATKKGNAR